MKQKFLSLGLLVLILCSFIPICGSLPAPPKRIMMVRLEDKPRTKSSFTPLEAFVQETSMYIQFNSSLGNADITVTAQNGAVMEQQSIIATEGSIHHVDISLWKAGIYTLRITTGNEIWTGQFSIDE